MDKFKQGYALLEKKGLTYDADLYTDQLDGFIELVSNIPSTKIV